MALIMWLVCVVGITCGLAFLAHTLIMHDPGSRREPEEVKQLSLKVTIFVALLVGGVCSGVTSCMLANKML